MQEEGRSLEVCLSKEDWVEAMDHVFTGAQRKKFMVWLDQCAWDRVMEELGSEMLASV